MVMRDVIIEMGERLPTYVFSTNCALGVTCFVLLLSQAYIRIALLSEMVSGLDLFRL